MRMKILVLSCAIWSSPAFVCAQCFVFPKPEEGFARSTTVLAGRVIAHHPTGVDGNHLIEDVATFQVERVWKGDLGREVQVGAELPFETGKQYVVFASGEPLSTSILCHWTELREQATSKLDWLSTKKALELRSADPPLSSRIGTPVSAKYAAVRDASEWLNPFLVVCADGVHLVARSVKRESVVSIGKVREALVSLPVEAWPYGRIAAVQECSIRGVFDTPAIRERLAHLLAVLESLGVVINRWPS